MLCLTLPDAVGIGKEEPLPFPTESRGNSLPLNFVNFSKSLLFSVPQHRHLKVRITDHSVAVVYLQHPFAVAAPTNIRKGVT